MVRAPRRPLPTYDQVCRWLAQPIGQAGAQVRLGAELASVFAKADLPKPIFRLESIVASGPSAIDAVRLVINLVATLMPTMERLGIATASEIALPSLVSRIMAEVEPDGRWSDGRNALPGQLFDVIPVASRMLSDILLSAPLW